VNKEEYAQYLQTEHWSKVRHRALEYAERRCQVCYSPKQVEVHHRTYERIGHERPADLTVLCRECHAKHHDRGAGDSIVIGNVRFPIRRSRRRIVLQPVDRERFEDMPGRTAD
jgi:hypothetical protein